MIGRVIWSWTGIALCNTWKRKIKKEIKKITLNYIYYILYFRHKLKLISTINKYTSWEWCGQQIYNMRFKLTCTSEIWCKNWCSKNNIEIFDDTHI